MSLILRAQMMELVADADATKRWHQPWLEVTRAGSVTTTPRWHACLPAYSMMCESIMSDVGPEMLENIRLIESGEEELVDPHGNAWVHFITREKVWFEGLYSQGEGGAVTFAQYKLAVETYLRFLADPEHKPIEVEFPDS